MQSRFLDGGAVRDDGLIPDHDARIEAGEISLEERSFDCAFDSAQAVMGISDEKISLGNKGRISAKSGGECKNVIAEYG